MQYNCLQVFHICTIFSFIIFTFLIKLSLFCFLSETVFVIIDLTTTNFRSFFLLPNKFPHILTAALIHGLSIQISDLFFAFMFYFWQIGQKCLSWLTINHLKSFSSLALQSLDHSFPCFLHHDHLSFPLFRNENIDECKSTMYANENNFARRN